jgi:hypothetical protein
VTADRSDDVSTRTAECTDKLIKVDVSIALNAAHFILLKPDKAIDVPPILVLLLLLLASTQVSF